METTTLIATLVLGLWFFLYEEFRDSPGYALVTLAISLSISGAVSRFILGKRTSILFWCLLCAFQATLTAILRPALVYGGYVSYLRGVDCFARLGLDHFTYILFAISGGVAGIFVAKRDPGGWLRLFPLVGVALGVLYHYKVAQGFWSSPTTLMGIVLLIFEFFAPSIYAWLLAWGAHVLRNRIEAVSTKA